MKAAGMDLIFSITPMIEFDPAASAPRRLSVFE